MTGAARSTALALAVFVAAFAMAAVAAGAAYQLAVREPAPRPKHVKPDPASRAPEWLMWTVSLVVRMYRYEDGGPKAAVLLATLFLSFSVLIGASQ